jgi:4-hydroxy-4-methyl-2-oxoglutarate aldolase
VVVVPRERAAEVLDASRAREEKEAVSRERYKAGEVSLDVYGMREALERKGLRYVDHQRRTEPQMRRAARRPAGGKG